jgi:phosphoribosylaminoimidazole (AIR) synthetase
MDESMDYASAGVDIDLEGSAVASLIGALSKSVRKPGTPGAPLICPADLEG